MKIFLTIAFLCAVGISFSLAETQSFYQRRLLRRRNGVANSYQPQEYARNLDQQDHVGPSFREEQVPEYISRKTLPKQKKRAQQYAIQQDDSPVYQPQPIVQEPATPKNRKQSYAKDQFEPSQETGTVEYSAAPAEAPSSRDVAASPSQSYGDYDSGSYDSEHAKFEQGIQNYAGSYNTDQGVKDGRLHFAIHGQQGPNSYRFGYDTGHGANRVFRFEERDNEGIVHGRYGYYDNYGKLRIVNYSAHPQYGFQAEGNFGPK